MMNELDRLRLLETTLANTIIGSVEGMGALANDIESIRASLNSVSEEFAASFARLWAALEVVAVEHQEQGTELTQKEIKDLENMKKDLSKWTEREIAARARVAPISEA